MDIDKIKLEIKDSMENMVNDQLAPEDAHPPAQEEHSPAQEEGSPPLELDVFNNIAQIINFDFDDMISYLAVINAERLQCARANFSQHTDALERRSIAQLSAACLKQFVEIGEKVLSSGNPALIAIFLKHYNAHFLQWTQTVETYMADFPPTGPGNEEKQEEDDDQQSTNDSEPQPGPSSDMYKIPNDK